jgi:hypothetical protein
MNRLIIPTWRYGLHWERTCLHLVNVGEVSFLYYKTVTKELVQACCAKGVNVIPRTVNTKIMKWPSLTKLHQSWQVAREKLALNLYKH